MTRDPISHFNLSKDPNPDFKTFRILEIFHFLLNQLPLSITNWDHFLHWNYSDLMIIDFFLLLRIENQGPRRNILKRTF